jgi:hypothetical protein
MKEINVKQEFQERTLLKINVTMPQLKMSVLIAAWCLFTLIVVAGCLVPAGWLPNRLFNNKLLHLLSFAASSLTVAAVAPTAGRGPWSGR